MLFLKKIKSFVIVILVSEFSRVGRPQSQTVLGRLKRLKMLISKVIIII